MPKYLLTGGAGFIGSNLVRHILATRPDVELINLDALTYAGSLANLQDVLSHPRHHFVHGDITDRALVRQWLADVDCVLHLAAESHVDRSILDASAFIRTNVEGTQILLDAAREVRVRRFLHVSTDEVYGSLGAEGRFTESTPLAPNSPYAASKAAAELLARAAFHTHGLPVLITRCGNNYGPHQHPEKFIPLVISNALSGQAIPVYGTGANVRNWIHVHDHAAGLLAVLNHGEPGMAYNLSSDDELDNLTLARKLLSIAGAPESLLRFVPDRPGHDFRYSLDSSLARTRLSWSPRIALAEGLESTVAWYRDHSEWIRQVRNPEFNRYYQSQYASRLEHAAKTV